MDTENASLDPPELATNSFRFLLLFVFLIDLVMFYHFLFSFYLFLTLVHLTSTQRLRLQALSQWVKQIQSRVLISRRRRLSTN